MNGKQQARRALTLFAQRPQRLDHSLAVWDTLSFASNGLVFFWAGIASINYLIRWGGGCCLC